MIEWWLLILCYKNNVKQAVKIDVQGFAHGC